jgi:hypothetical protein
MISDGGTTKATAVCSSSACCGERAWILFRFRRGSKFCTELMTHR